MNSSEPIVVVSARGNAYKVLNGTFYNIDTPDNLVQILEVARENNDKAKLRIYYGNPLDKTYWGEVVTCCIGRTDSGINIPLVLINKRYKYGVPLMDSCIMKMELKVNKRYKLVYKVI